MSSGIYRTTNAADGKVYIGQSKNLETRLAQHKSSLRSGKHTNLKLQDAWDRDGGGSFVFEIVMLLDDNRCLNSAEEGWLYLTKCCDPRHGYNTKGGAAGIVPRARLSPWRQGGSSPWLDRRHSKRLLLRKIRAER